MLLVRPFQNQSIRIGVLETFKIYDTCAALLVHHAEPETRDVFAKWLQTHPSAAIRIRRQDGQEVPATIFRVRMCFGRGLILLQSGLPVREREILTMTFERDLG